MRLRYGDLYPVVRTIARYSKTVDAPKSRSLENSLSLFRQGAGVLIEGFTGRLHLQRGVAMESGSEIEVLHLKAKEVQRFLTPMPDQDDNEVIVFEKRPRGAGSEHYLLRPKYEGHFLLGLPGTLKNARKVEAHSSEIILTPEHLEDLIWVMKACSQDETRFQLQGVFFDGENMVATDGHRMHLARFPRPLTKVPTLFDADILRLMLSMASRAESSQIILRRTRYCDVIIAGPWTLFNNQLNPGEFPPYNQVIPDPARTLLAFTAKTAHLTTAVDMLTERPRNLRGQGVAFATSSNRLYLHNEDGTHSICLTDAEVEAGYDARFGLRGSYLVEAADDSSETRVMRDRTNELSPVRIDYRNRTAIVMPMRI